MPKHPDPPAWAFSPDSYARSRSNANIIGLPTSKPYPRITGLIEQQGVNAAGTDWYFVERIHAWVLYRLPGENRATQIGFYNLKPFPEHTGQLEQIDDAIVEIAPNRTAARVKFKTWDRVTKFYTYDWLAVTIRAQSHRRLSVGEAIFRAIKVWHTLPLTSGQRTDRHDDFFNSYDSGFYGVEL
jgi:hypothetical protein